MVAGAIAHAATTGLSVARRVTSAAQPDFTLAVALPGIPTWWVPESAWGLGLAVLVAPVGVATLRMGRMYERLLRR